MLLTVLHDGLAANNSAAENNDADDADGTDAGDDDMSRCVTSDGRLSMEETTQEMHDDLEMYVFDVEHHLR